MKICFVLLHHDPAYTDPRRFFGRAPIMRHLPQAVAARGHQVDVVMRFAAPHTFMEGGVTYHLIPPPRLVAGRTPRIASFTPAIRAIRAVRRLRPDVIHFHGTNLYVNHALLLAALGRDRPPVVVHYHGGQPSPNPLARRLQRYNCHQADRFLFTTREHARPFIDAGLIKASEQVEPFMETSSPLRRQARAEARRRTGMTGAPVFLWTGRLDANKDPMTALRGFARILDAWPNAHLYLHYLTDALLPSLKQYVAERPPLQAHVHFQGRAPFEAMEAIYNSADFFLQASHHEFSGLAVLDALACGVIPVVTDIPSFRAMTNDGQYGILFPPEDVDALTRRVLAFPRDTIAEHATQIRAWFDRTFSFPALARQLEGVYHEMVTGTPSLVKDEEHAPHDR